MEVRKNRKHHRNERRPALATIDLMNPVERAVLCAGYRNGDLDPGEEPLQELSKLVETAGVVEVGRIWQNVKSVDSKTFIGKGKCIEVKELAEQTNANLIIFDHELAPNQGRELEAAIGRRVLDRSELILDIFASRARTHMAKLQVALALAQYRLPRLRRLWTHLERQRGGTGMRSGPGEKQIDLDRGMLEKKIDKYKADIRTFEEQRARVAQSRAGENFTVALVGYTNAGKSTLMNLLTNAGVYADNKLFATLDTHTRLLKLPNGKQAMLSDTVGFIQRLPHNLIASFHATLEETLQADLLLHVVDCAHPYYIKQMKAVAEVLQQIGAADKPTVTVFNKIDVVEDKVGLGPQMEIHKPAVLASAKTGQGIPELLDLVLQHLAAQAKSCWVRVAVTDGQTMAYLKAHAFEHARDFKDNAYWLQVDIDPALIQHLQKNRSTIEVVKGVPK
ncbi:MAG TPA: GTPase HflX [Planctomycetota bacterium]|nr:GTPase HflX [Planctomycetota bacterium]